MSKIGNLYGLDRKCGKCGAENGDHNIDGSCPTAEQRRSREALQDHKRGKISLDELRAIRDY